jgi:hypothetical protein
MMTVRLEAAIRRLDRIIAEMEESSPLLDRASFRKLLACRQRRTDLKLLLIARRIECQRKVVSLERWRCGFEQAKRTLPALSR